MKFMETIRYNKKQVPSRYTDEFFEEFSLRAWIVWDVEMGFVLVYEYEDYIEDMRLIRGLIKV